MNVLLIITGVAFLLLGTILLFISVINKSLLLGIVGFFIPPILYLYGLFHLSEYKLPMTLVFISLSMILPSIKASDVAFFYNE